MDSTRQMRFLTDVVEEHNRECAQLCVPSIQVWLGWTLTVKSNVDDGYCVCLATPVCSSAGVGPNISGQNNHFDTATIADSVYGSGPA